MGAEALSPEELQELELLLHFRDAEESLSAEERERLQRRAQLEAELSAFVRAAWHVIRPGQDLKWSWHYDLIAEYLTLAYERRVRRLIVNISPRTLKSILVTVMFPVWVWTKQPTHNFACASYSAELSTEHSVMRRNLIESNWFRSLWGEHISLAADQNEKRKFRNNHEAQMIATSTGGALGFGADTLILDDGLKADEASSDVIRKSAFEWFHGTWSNRLNDQATGAMIVVEQRTHEMDFSGSLLAAGGWTHLCLPLEAEEHERWVFPVSGRVVEREEGAILQPDRFPPEVVARLKTQRLVWSGQYQQHPAPLEGNMVKRSDVRYYGGMDPVTGERDISLPAKFDNVILSADCAFKDLKTSDYVCVGAIGVKGPNRFLLNLTLQHLDEPATEAEILRQRRTYGAKVVLVEDKANGPAVIKKLQQKIPGVIAIEPQGGKVARMFAACGAWQAGNWSVDRTAAWTQPFIESITKFPTAAHDDDVDMMTQAEIWLQQNTFSYSLTDYYRRAEEDLMARRRGETPKKAKQNGQLTSPAEDPVESVAPEAQTDEAIKLAVPDNVARCQGCGSVLVQRLPGGGKRCGQCGKQWDQAGINQSSPGQLRKR